MGIGKTIGMIGGGIGGFVLGGPAGAALGAAGGGMLGDELDGDDTPQAFNGRVAKDAPRYGGLGAYGEAERASQIGADNAAAARAAGRDSNVGANHGIATSTIARGDADRRATGLYGDAAGMYGRAEGNAADAASARGDSMAAIGRLRSFYEGGPGPSAAEAQLRQGQDSANRNAMSIAATGGGGAAARRAAMRASAAGNQQTNQAAGTLRAQEAAQWQQTKLGAMGAERDALAGVRAGDVGIMGQRLGAAGQQLGAAGNERQIGLGYGAQAAGYQGLYQQGRMGSEAMAQSATAAGEQNRAGALGQQLGADTSRYGADRGVAVGMANVAQRDRAADMSMYGSLIGSGVQMMSDIRAKENVRPVSAANLVSRVDALQSGGPNLRNAGGYAYDYKNASFGPDNQVGPMAQELEQTDAAGAVSTGPDGMKSVDPGRLTMTNTSAIAEQQRRLDRLEAMASEESGADWQPKGAETQGQRTIRKTEAFERRRMSDEERRAMATFGHSGSIKPRDEEFVRNYGGRR